jgi:hypothetical protein
LLHHQARSQHGRLRTDEVAAGPAALALLNAAISDALATVMETKYHYNFWRPTMRVIASGPTPR